jgi:hypothetical protein
MGVKALAQFFHDVTEEDGNLDCMPSNVIMAIYEHGSKYIMWEINNYER